MSILTSFSANAQFSRVTPTKCAPNLLCRDWMLKDFGTQAETRRFYLVSYTNSAPNIRSLALRLPRKYVGEDTFSPDASFGIAFFVSLSKSERSNLSPIVAECRNDCRSKALVVVSYEYAHNIPLPERDFDVFLAGMGRQTTVLTRGTPTYGFDLVLDDRGVGDQRRSDSTDYYRFPTSASPPSSVNCLDNTPVLVCSGKASSARFDGLAITVSFDRSYLSSWLEFSSQILLMLDQNVVARTPTNN